MAKVVKTTNPDTGTELWLRGTTWAFHEERAQIFDDEDAAKSGLERSKKFNKAWAAKRAIIEDVS